MSRREDIAANIVTVLDAMTTPELKLITRDPFDPEDLSNAQFPAAWIEASNEDRKDLTIGGATITRDAEVEYLITGFVKGENVDTARNQLIEGIEEALDADRTRGGYALDTVVTRIETDRGSLFPIGGVELTAKVYYTFTRGDT